MSKVIALFGNVPEKGKIIVSFMDAEKANTEVVRAVIKTDESITALGLSAKKKFENLDEKFEIQEIHNGYRFSTTAGKPVPAKPVLQTTVEKVINILKEEVPV